MERDEEVKERRVVQVPSGQQPEPDDEEEPAVMRAVEMDDEY